MAKRKKKTAKIGSKPKHVSKGSILDDLELSSEERATLDLKIFLFEAIEKRVAQKDYSRRDLEKIFDVPQPRVSDLMRGKIGKMRIETLIAYAAKLGLKAEISLRKAA